MLLDHRSPHICGAYIFSVLLIICVYVFRLQQNNIIHIFALNGDSRFARLPLILNTLSISWAVFTFCRRSIRFVSNKSVKMFENFYFRMRLYVWNAICTKFNFRILKDFLNFIFFFWNAFNYRDDIKNQIFTFNSLICM